MLLTEKMLNAARTEQRQLKARIERYENALKESVVFKKLEEAKAALAHVERTIAAHEAEVAADNREG